MYSLCLVTCNPRTIDKLSKRPPLTINVFGGCGIGGNFDVSCGCVVEAYDWQATCRTSLIYIKINTVCTHKTESTRYYSILFVKFSI